MSHQSTHLDTTVFIPQLQGVKQVGTTLHVVACQLSTRYLATKFQTLGTWLTSGDDVGMGYYSS